MYEYLRYTDVTDNATGGKVRYRSSARCKVNVKRTNADVEVNGFAALSVAAHLQRVDAAVEIEGLGIKPGPVADAIPKFSQLDLSNYVKLAHAFTNALPTLMKDDTQLRPRVLGVWGEKRDGKLGSADMSRALAIGYALTEIAKGVRLGKQKYGSTAPAAFRATVLEIYEMLGVGDDEAPTPLQVAQAKDALKGLKTEIW